VTRSRTPEGSARAEACTDNPSPTLSNRWLRRAARYRPQLATPEVADVSGRYAHRGVTSYDPPPRPMAPARRRTARAARKGRKGQAR